MRMCIFRYILIEVFHKIFMFYFRDTLKRVLSLPMNTIMEYKTHDNSIR
jgi:hypothetical protein